MSKTSPTVAALITTEVPDVIVTSLADKRTPFKNTSAKPASYASVFPKVSAPVNVV